MRLALKAVKEGLVLVDKVGNVERDGRQRAFARRLPPERRRLLVLSAALAVFAEVGYEQASTTTIAKAAGVTRTVLYHYYASKQELYLAVLTEQESIMSSYVTEHIAAQGDSVARILASAMAYLDFANDHPETWAILLDDTALADPICATGRQAIHQAIVDRALDALAGDLDVYSEDSESRQVAMHFMVSGFNGVIRWRRAHPEVPRDAIIEVLVRLFASLSALLATTGGAHQRE